MQVVYHSHIECPSIGLQIKLRGFLSHIEQLRIGYWGITSTKTQSMSHGLASPRSPTDENQQPAEASVVGRSWVQSMFSKDTTSKSNSFSRVRRWTSDSGSTGIFFPMVICLFHWILFLNNLPPYDTETFFLFSI